VGNPPKLRRDYRLSRRRYDELLAWAAQDELSETAALEAMIRAAYAGRFGALPPPTIKAPAPAPAPAPARFAHHRLEATTDDDVEFRV